MMAWPHASTVWCDEWPTAALRSKHARSIVSEHSHRALPCTQSTSPPVHPPTRVPRPGNATTTAAAESQACVGPSPPCNSPQGGLVLGRAGATSQTASPCNHHVYLLLHLYRSRPHSHSAVQESETARRLLAAARSTLPRLVDSESAHLAPKLYSPHPKYMPESV